MKKAIVFLAVLSILAGSAFLKGGTISKGRDHREGDTEIKSQYRTADGSLAIEKQDNINNSIGVAGVYDIICVERVPASPDILEVDRIYDGYKAGLKKYSGSCTIFGVGVREKVSNYYKGVGYG